MIDGEYASYESCYAGFDFASVWTMLGNTPVLINNTGSASEDNLGTSILTNATTRRALLIGQQDYGGDDTRPGKASVGYLSNALSHTNDNWKINSYYNVTKTSVRSKIYEVFGNASASDINLFYFCGHGSPPGGQMVCYDGTYISTDELANWLKAQNGHFFVIIDTCGSGGVIAQNSFNEAVVNSFAELDSRTIVPNLGELRTSKFSVLTACNNTEYSFSITSSDLTNGYFLFTGLAAEGAGFPVAQSGSSFTQYISSEMPADINGDSRVTFYETYKYTYESIAAICNKEGLPGSHVQIYPQGCNDVLFNRAATLTAPSITSHPQSATVTSGENVTFRVTATGGGLSYQWQFRANSSANWVDSGAPGSKTATLTFAPTYQNGYQYRCKVSNSLGEVYSNIATLTVKPIAPKITSHPQSTSVAYGTDVSFKVAASGTSLSYQWQFRTNANAGWVNSGAPGCKTAKLSFTANSQNGYQYRCKVSNSAGTVYSNIATLTVRPVTPVITTQPQSASVAYGADVSFKVAATGGNLSYQWQFRTSASAGWVNSGAPGSKTATLTFAPTYQNGYQYRCKVSNSAGAVYSSVATLTVRPISPTITSQPQSASVTYGADVTFKVAATGGGLSYQWQFRANSSAGWVNSGAPGSKSASLTFASTSQNGYQYRCKVSNSVGTVYSNVATLTVRPVSPTITSQPQSVTAERGTQVTFKVAATGGALSYQWQYRTSSGGIWLNSGAPGSKTPAITFDVDSQNGYQYRCKVSNSAGSLYSSAATLTVKAVAPAITQHPQSVTAASGAQVTFAVTATGSNLSYQWQYRTGSGAGWVNSGAPGSKTASISFAVASQSGYQYRCKVSNSLGTVYSNAATLTVKATAPSITKHPQSVTAPKGADVSFKVTASGSSLSYQWQYRTSSSASWVNSGAPGNKTAAISFTAATQNGYQYRCKVSNSLGTVYSNAATLTISAQSAWVPASQAPAGAKIVARSWSYRESTTSTSSSLSGWTANGSHWVNTGSGSVQYSNEFPSGFDTSNSIYTSLNRSPYTAYEYTDTKREVTNSHAGYVYWHWMYDCGGANAYNRAIYYRYGYGGSDCANSNWLYKYFGAFKSSTSFGQVSNGYGQSGIYQWYKVTGRTSYADTQGSYYFYRLNYYTSSYTDYTRYYDYYRNLQYQPTDPGNGSNISNKVEYVKYSL